MHSAQISWLTGSVTLALLASVFWGAADFVGGLATRRAAPSFVVAIAHGSSLLLVLIYAVATHAEWPSRHTLIFGLIGGAVGGLGLILFYGALAMGEMGLTASVAGVLTAAVPVIYSFFTEALPKPTQLAGFGIAAAAIWLVASSPGSKLQLRSLTLAAVSGVGFGSMLILLRLADHGALWPLGCSRMASAAVGIAASLLALYRKRRQPVAPCVGRWYVFAGLGALAGVLDSGGNVCYTTAAMAGRLDVAAVLSSLYPAVTILLAAWLMHERARRSQALGMGLALVAVVLISL